jgi:hypothetical protein
MPFPRMDNYKSAANPQTPMTKVTVIPYPAGKGDCHFAFNQLRRIFSTLTWELPIESNFHPGLPEWQAIRCP